MEPLNLDMFLTPPRDREISEYKILDYLKNCREEFNTNRLYPELADLRVLASRLETILEQKTYLKTSPSGKVKSTIIKGKYVSLESEEYNSENNSDECIELIEWTLDQFYSLIEEGLVIYDFVVQNLVLEPVGKIPRYKDEGYLLVPDNINSLLTINQYECSMGYAACKPIRSVKTMVLKSIPLEAHNRPPKEVKKELIKDKIILPGFSVFSCQTDLDFDFTQTILPIARKKLVYELMY
ncbi:MAG TPA: hypothetical protein VKA26_15610 [Ignavibacteriaceae bacterium]|nr:hypothetical protein [Ignavibacteriaceae bacterium]